MRFKNLIILSIVLFTFVLYFPTTRFGFISDDYFYLSFTSLTKVISLVPGFYHYNPVFWFLMYSLYKIWGSNAFIFHLATLTIHLLNVYLVYIVTHRILKTQKISLLTAFLFSLYFANYEVVFWITGLSTSLMVFFYLLGILSFVIFIERNSKIHLFLYLFYFVLALLTHEYALSLPVVAFTYFFIFAKRPPLKNVFLILGLPLLFAFFPLFLKSLIGVGMLTPSSPNIVQFITSVIKSLLYLFFPLVSYIDAAPKLILPISAFIIVSYLFKEIRKDKQFTLFFLWSCVTLILFCLTSHPQARYLYLSAIPSLCCISYLLLKLKKPVFFTVVFILIAHSFLFQIDQYKNWQKANEIISSTKESLTDYFGTKAIKEVVFLNVPDKVNSGPWIAYVWRNGLEHYVNQQYGVDLSSVYFYTTEPKPAMSRNDALLKNYQLAELRKTNALVLEYDQQNGRFK